MPQDPTLPPGVSVGMIPGNRPEDEWFEKYVDALEIPNEFTHLASPENTARLTNSFLRTMSEVVAAGLVEGTL